MANKEGLGVLFVVSLGFITCSTSKALFTHEDRNVFVGDAAAVHRALHSGPTCPGCGHCLSGDPPVLAGTAAPYVRGPSGKRVDRGSLNRVGGSGSGESPGGVPVVRGVGQRRRERRGANGGAYGGVSRARNGGTHGGYAP